MHSSPTPASHCARLRSEKEAMQFMQNGDCAVLLLCYLLPLEVRKRLAENFRTYCPTSRVIAITNEKLENPDFAHAFVYAFDGPEVLIEALREVNHSGV